MIGLDNCKYPRIFELLKEQGKTAAALSRDLKISKGNITDWKSGRTAPSQATFIAIANYLDTTPAYLLGTTDEKKPPAKAGGVEADEDVKSFSDILEDLSDDELQMVSDFVALLKRKRTP